MQLGGRVSCWGLLKAEVSSGEVSSSGPPLKQQVQQTLTAFTITSQHLELRPRNSRGKKKCMNTWQLFFLISQMIHGIFSRALR